MKKKNLIIKYKRKTDNEINIHFMNFYDDGWSDTRFKFLVQEYLLNKEEYITVDELRAKLFHEYKGHEAWTPNELIEEVNRSFPRSYIINIGEDFVLNLNSSSVVLREESEYFPFFFFFRLSCKKVNEIKSFLDFHLEKSFQNDHTSYFEFLEDGILMFEAELNLLPNSIIKIQRWLEDKREVQSFQSPSNNTEIKEVPPNSHAETKKKLNEILSNHPEDILLTPEEVSDMLRIPISSIYKLSSAGEIPRKKIGQSLRFKKSELLAWINSKSVPTIFERSNNVKDFLSSNKKKK